jgi:hypothetical protein
MKCSFLQTFLMNCKEANDGGWLHPPLPRREGPPRKRPPNRQPRGHRRREPPRRPFAPSTSVRADGESRPTALRGANGGSRRPVKATQRPLAAPPTVRRGRRTSGKQTFAAATAFRPRGWVGVASQEESESSSSCARPPLSLRCRLEAGSLPHVRSRLEQGRKRKAEGANTGSRKRFHESPFRTKAFSDKL